MKKLMTFTIATILSFSGLAQAEGLQPTPAVAGYDVVEYFSSNSAVRGSGFHTAEHQGKTYLFSSQKNRDAFNQSPEKYLPQYDGWCAYGVALGKKFYADPTVFEIVDGKLYLNLDKEIQKKWAADKVGQIKTANMNWNKVAKL